MEKTLKAEVVVGGQIMPVELHPRFRQPGAYNGDFVPTRPGSYTFRFSGNVDGRAVNEVFESGPGRFNDVQAVAPLQFPDKIDRSCRYLAPRLPRAEPPRRPRCTQCLACVCSA